MQEPRRVKLADATERAIETASLEDAIGAALESMWRAAEAAEAKGRDDFYDACTADVMTRQPTIFVAVALPGETMAWLIDPSENEGVLEAHVSPCFDLPDASGWPRHDGPPQVATREAWTRLYHELAEDVSWLVRERSGQHLGEHDRWIPETG
jgi:hypothetical protein